MINALGFGQHKGKEAHSGIRRFCNWTKSWGWMGIFYSISQHSSSQVFVEGSKIQLKMCYFFSSFLIAISKGISQ